MIRPAAALLVSLTALTSALHAQTTDCTYDRCALRVQHSFWGDKVVKGADAFPVGTLGFVAPRIEPLETATGDSTSRYYQTFRAKHSTGNILYLLGTAAVIASFFVVAEDYQVDGQASGTAIGLISGGLVLSIVGGITLRSGGNHLSRSIWHYNRALPR